jgi:antitoxin CptB
MNDEAEFRKLKWRCRRGMRELDQLFERWLDTRWRAASTQQRDTFLRLLDSEDDRLWRWFLGHETPSDDALRALVDDMRETPPA